MQRQQEMQIIQEQWELDIHEEKKGTADAAAARYADTTGAVATGYTGTSNTAAIEITGTTYTAVVSTCPLRMQI